MHPFVLTRFQKLLIAVALAFLTVGAHQISGGAEIVGVGLWQIAVLAGVGTIAAGNVRWIVVQIDRVLDAAHRIQELIQRHSQLLEHKAELAEATAARLEEILAESRELRRTVQEILLVDVRHLRALGITADESGPQRLP